MTHVWLSDFGVVDEDQDRDESPEIVLAGPSAWDPCPVHGCDAIRGTAGHVPGREGCPKRAGWAA